MNNTDHSLATWDYLVSLATRSSFGFRFWPLGLLRFGDLGLGCLDGLPGPAQTIHFLGGTGVFGELTFMPVKLYQL
jgi:hypothetical protein